VIYSDRNSDSDRNRNRICKTRQRMITMGCTLVRLITAEMATVPATEIAPADTRLRAQVVANDALDVGHAAVVAADAPLVAVRNAGVVAVEEAPAEEVDANKPCASRRQSGWVSWVGV
jgi:hypothetical protein